MAGLPQAGKSGVESGSSGRLQAVDCLRGLAAFSVAWFHITAAGAYLPQTPVISTVSAYTNLGVEVFFVISGFILPWSLYRATYSISGYGRFLARRIVRIDPPYLAAVVLVLALNYASGLTPGFRGTEPFIGWWAVLGHIAFLNAFTGQRWLNIVFWTLAIEFQYYLLIGLVFPLVVSKSRVVRSIVATALLIAPQIDSHKAFLPVHAPVFLLGILAFQFRAGIESLGPHVFMSAIAVADLWYLAGPVPALVSLAAALTITFARGDSAPFTYKPLLGLGTISYSLYLLHVPVGGRVINLAHRIPQTPQMQWLAVTAALVISLLAATILYRFVEKPARELASRISWDRAILTSSRGI